MRVAEEGNEPVADEVDRGFVAGDQQQPTQCEDLVVAQSVITVARLDETADEVVHGLRSTVLGEGGEVLAECEGGPVSARCGASIDQGLHGVEVENEDRPIETKVRTLLAAISHGFTSDPEFMAIVATRSSLFRGAQGGVLDRERAMYDLLTDMFRRAQLRGEIRGDLDPRRLAETFTGAYMLATVNWLVGWWGESGDLADRLDEQATVLLSGCLTSEVDPQRQKKR